MPARVSLDDLDAVPVDRPDTDATVLPVGYELRPGKIRPSVWKLPAGESTPYHRQREQEELYLVLSGRVEVRLGGPVDERGEPTGDANADAGSDSDDNDGEETFELGPREVLVVEPEIARGMTALEDTELFVVGAPNVTDDGVILDRSS
ncbi:cupin domain-containing protein [Salinigranum sp. GCM10025319]|uniref:cupin domain-containing protein n=1 Tax=Salinigranum sp. GCM10025319 TaxID=3252687 RepID=UPI0036127F47